MVAFVRVAFREESFIAFMGIGNLASFRDFMVVCIFFEWEKFFFFFFFFFFWIFRFFVFMNYKIFQSQKNKSSQLNKAEKYFIYFLFYCIFISNIILFCLEKKKNKNKKIIKFI